MGWLCLIELGVVPASLDLANSLRYPAGDKGIRSLG